VIWKKRTTSKDWRKNIMVPLLFFKREERETAGNYRGISLLCSAYKIYAEVLRNRLEKEVEVMGLIPESQASFRKRRSTIDNIFILNYLMQRENRQGEKKMKMYLRLFADLMAAFDNMEKKILWRESRKRGMKERLITRRRYINKQR